MLTGGVPDYECKRLPDDNTTRYHVEGECSLVVEQGGVNVTEECAHGYTYDQQFDSTIVTEVPS